MRAAHPGPARADAAEVVAHAATAAHGLGGLGQRGVDAGVAIIDLGDRIAHRLHEAVDQRGGQVGAGGRLDASGRNEALFQRLQEARLPVGAARRCLGLGQCRCHALVHLQRRGFVAFGVLFLQHFGADGLGRKAGRHGMAGLGANV